MKKIFACALCAVMLCTVLSACGDNRVDDDGLLNDLPAVTAQVSPDLSPDIEDGIVDDKDGMIDDNDTIGTGTAAGDNSASGNGSAADNGSTAGTGTAVSPSPAVSAKP